MAWPSTDEGWGRHLERARDTYAGLANAITAFEPLTMLVHASDRESARSALTAAADIVEIPFESAWVRDWGPLVLVDDKGGRAGIDFGFNGWGGRDPGSKSAAAAAAILDHLGIDCIESAMVLEGGAITVDGEGTLITTEQCLLNQNRNPDMSRSDIERELADKLGISKVVWLPVGIAADFFTDGHVDAVCTFAAPGTVIAQACDDPGDPDFDRMAANLEVLAHATDAGGRPFEVIELPNLPSEAFDGTEIGVAYANVHVVNGGVIVGVGDYPTDTAALDALRRAFPGREVVGVPGAVFSYNGGGPHCTTMQIPAPQQTT